MKQTCFAFLIFAALVSFAATAELKESSEFLTIDLPTTLGLAGARSIDIQLAREKFAEARAAEESAVERFFPWVAAGVTYRRHDNLIQNTAGMIQEVPKQTYPPSRPLPAPTNTATA